MALLRCALARTWGAAYVVRCALPVPAAERCALCVGETLGSTDVAQPSPAVLVRVRAVGSRLARPTLIEIVTRIITRLRIAIVLGARSVAVFGAISAPIILNRATCRYRVAGAGPAVLVRLTLAITAGPAQFGVTVLRARVAGLIVVALAIAARTAVSITVTVAVAPSVAHTPVSTRRGCQRSWSGPRPLTVV